MSRWARLPLAARLVLAFTSLAVASLMVALVVTTLAVERAAEEKIARDLDRALEAFKQFADATQERLQEVAESRVSGQTLKDVFLGVNSEDDALGLGDGDAEAESLEYARELILSADEAVLFGRDPRARLWALFNASGKLVYSHAAPEQLGASAASLELLQLTQRQGPLFTLWSAAQLRALPFTFVPPEELRPRDLLLVHAQPALGPRRTYEGVVLTGRWVGELVLASLSGTGAQSQEGGDTRTLFALRTQEGALASPPGFPSGTVLEDPSFSAPQVRRIHLGDVRYLVREDVFQGPDGAPLGRVFVLRDLDAEIDPILSGFRAWLLPTAVGVLLFSLGIAFVLARRLSAPLVRLEATARRVRLGELNVEPLPVSSGDEVGRLTGAFNEMVAGLRQRDQIKGLFKRYLDPQVVDELIRNPEKAAPGGERRELTVLFSDLAGFTSLSEELSPEALVELLNTYFERATEALARQGATLDKFIGDAIMCFWNAPLPQEDHAARACLSALALLEVVDTLGPEFRARGWPPLDCRIGLNTGPGIVGNLGSRAAQDYTVIGDTVNLASRLEGAAKVFGTRTLVSEATVAAARGAVLVRELDLLRVKGRQLPVRVFELVGAAGATPAPHLARYTEGLALYRAREFHQARAAFLASPEDPASRLFAARCERLLVTPPPPTWDGVFTLDSK